MKVAIVHHWLVNMRGGEKVVQALCELYPQADIFTHVHAPENLGGAFAGHRVCTSFIQRLPKAKTLYQNYLPLMPLALEQLDLRGYDLVISSESGPAKGVLTSPETLHICYCNTPMRYVWDMYHDYLEGVPRFKRLLIPPLMHYLRLWDQASANRVDHFVTNSAFVAKRVAKHYRREAEVIYPPVDTEDFSPGGSSDDFYLIVGQLVGYKRADLAVEAFNRSGRRLVVIGAGEQLEQLRPAAGANIEVLGRQSFDVIRDHYRRCRALIFPGVEDFGIVPVEAMASGRPVIAYGQGGALETVKDGVSGMFFREQTPEALNECLDRFEERVADFRPETISAHARQFDRSVFKQRIESSIKRLLD